MRLFFIDYPAQYEYEIETWCDEAALRFALDEDSIKAEHRWYLDSDDYTRGENYFCKIALDGETPVALLMLTKYGEDEEADITENIVYFDTIIINPALRGQGYGAKILTELIQLIQRAGRHIGGGDIFDSSFTVYSIFSTPPVYILYYYAASKSINFL